jgi:RNA polymerase sigma factor (sigma-70 family)
MATEPHRYEAGVRTGVLFERHGRMVLGFCRVLLRDVDEAADAAQQTFVDAHRALLGGTAVHDDAAWLAAIARNECRTRIVARMTEPLAVAYDDLVEAAGAAAPEEYEVLSDDVRRALAELPGQQREAVVLRDLYGLRYREVGAVLGLSRPAVESVLFRARRRLRTRLRPVAGSLVVPVGLRDSLAQMVPGFAGGEGGAAVVGAAGATGLLVKLGSGPVAAKLAAGAVAVGAGGGSLAVALDDRDRGGPSGTATTRVTQRAVVEAAASAAAAADRRRGRSAVAMGDPTGSGSRSDHGSSGPGDDPSSSGPGSGPREAADAMDDSGGSGPGTSGPESGSSRSGSGSGQPEDAARDADPAADDESHGEGTSGSATSGPGSGGSSSGESGSGRDGQPGLIPTLSGSEDSTGSGQGSGSSGSGSSSAPTSSGSGSGPGSAGDTPAVEDSGSGSSGSGAGDD